MPSRPGTHPVGDGGGDGDGVGDGGDDHGDDARSSGDGPVNSKGKDTRGLQVG
ncbi:hypothetical protein KRMM14A1259_19600 [Krasilnikovia sp. MM14-A1259]